MYQGRFKGNLVQKLSSELSGTLMCVLHKNFSPTNTHYANQQVSQENPTKVSWKLQRLTGEDGTNKPDTSAGHDKYSLPAIVYIDST